jgi:hypothetical protein
MKQSLSKTIRYTASAITVDVHIRMSIGNKVWGSVWNPLRIPLNSSIGSVSNNMAEQVREIQVQSI